MGNVYLLLRPKRGKTAEERLEDLTKNEVGYYLKKKQTPPLYFSAKIPKSSQFFLIGFRNTSLTNKQRYIQEIDSHSR